MTTMKLLRSLLVTSLLVLPFAQAHSANTPPGTFGAVPDTLTVSPAATLLASTSGTLNSGTFTASYIENVYSDPTNQFGAGDLDFVIQLTDNGAVNGSGGASGTIEHITSSSFSNVMADVGIDSSGAPGLPNAGPAVLPSSIDRSFAGPGDVVTWDYTGFLNTLVGGSTTVLLEVQTNATIFKPGSIGAVDGAGAFGNGFAPVAPVPEPGMMALLGLGAIVVALVRRR